MQVPCKFRASGDTMNKIQDILEMIETFYALKRMYHRLTSRMAVAKNATTKPIKTGAPGGAPELFTEVKTWTKSSG